MLLIFLSLHYICNEFTIAFYYYKYSLSQTNPTTYNKHYNIFIYLHSSIVRAAVKPTPDDTFTVKIYLFLFLLDLLLNYISYNISLSAVHGLCPRSVYFPLTNILIFLLPFLSPRSVSFPFQNILIFEETKTR